MTRWPLLAAACAAEPAPPPPVLHAREAVLVSPAGQALAMQTAEMDREGRGSGTGVVATDPGPPPLEVEAPTSRWDLRAKQAVFEGGVTARRADVVMRCARLSLRFETVDRVQEVVAEGDVRVEQGERRASGERADLHVPTGQITLTGQPVLAEGPNRMSGERIVLWLDDERVECQACRLVVDGEAVRPR